jgi:hypothetical protein
MKKRVRDYLKKKTQGGVSNQQGNNFELYYTCYKIMDLARQYSKHPHLITISSQVEALVDDLMIRKQTGSRIHESYFQLKTSKRLSWGNKNKMGSLFYDFSAHQEELTQNTKLDEFTLHLVVSLSNIQKSMAKKRPTALKKKVKVDLFPYHDSISKYIMHHPSFRNAVARLCAYKDSDKLEALATCVLGVWVGSTKENITLSEILEKVRKINYSFLRSDEEPVLNIHAVNILKAIPNFNFDLTGGYLSWSYSSTDKGQIPYPIDSSNFRNIEAQIVSQAPTTFDQLENIIS